ncbi:unnamed protein product [Oikopleura dioica]|uniref:Uncharacterized protein n=1 Tax=Oikopleura dioica TaxID=34765 RepID=E4XI69_OIKDI|nr:unnamed protein product [Oikopleura dioica]
MISENFTIESLVGEILAAPTSLPSYTPLQARRTAIRCDAILFRVKLNNDQKNLIADNFRFGKESSSETLEKVKYK